MNNNNNIGKISQNNLPMNNSINGSNSAVAPGIIAPSSQQQQTQQPPKTNNAVNVNIMPSNGIAQQQPPQPSVPPSSCGQGIDTSDGPTTNISSSQQQQSTQQQPQNRNVDLLLNKQRLQELVNEIDPNEQLDEDVEDVLLEMADEFIENVVSSACMIAKHRKSSTLEVEDVQLYLERKYKMWIPGFNTSDTHPNRFSSEAHKQRLALIKKTLKKF